MDQSLLFYSAVLLISVFISSISQVMLKKSALKSYDSTLREYLNPLVIFAYVLFVGTTLLSVFAYRGIPLSMGPVLESTGYIYVTIFGVLIFKEHMTRGKWAALILIIAGIIV